MSTLWVKLSPDLLLILRAALAKTGHDGLWTGYLTYLLDGRPHIQAQQFNNASTNISPLVRPLEAELHYISLCGLDKSDQAQSLDAPWRPL